MNKIFLDCGIIKNIIHIKNQDKTKAFYSSLYNKNLFSANTPFFIYSPLLLLELIGVKMSDLISVVRLEKEFEVILENNKDKDKYILISLFFDRLCKIFYTEQLLTKSCVKHRIKKELDFRDDWGKGLLIQIFLNGINKNPISAFHKSLVFELIQNIDFKKYFDNDELFKMDLYQFKTYTQMHLELRTNIPFYRNISNIFKRHYPYITKYALREAEEAGDCELIHFSLLGHSSNMEEFQPVKIFTTEKIDKWKDRIELAVVFINYLNNEILPQINKANPEKVLPLIVLKPGFIFQVNQLTGEIFENHLNVEFIVNEVNSKRI